MVAAIAFFFLSTSSQPARQAFDRGVTLLYAYNGEAASASFGQALSDDPHLGMAAWGQALADGTDLNTPLTPDRFAASQRAAQEAVALESYASPHERAYIDAVALRYAGDYAQRDADEARYRIAMAHLVAAYPDDDDAATLYAEELMERLGTSRMWLDGGTLPDPDAATAIALIDRVLARDPQHHLANHLCIHAYDYARDRTPAIACADRVASWALDPQQVHLAHVPAHTYLEIGEYAKALAVSEHAWRLREASPVPLPYAKHDAYTGWSAAMMLGDIHAAETWADRVGAAYGGGDRWATWARFGAFDRILETNGAGEFFAPLTQGWADLQYGEVAQARRMLALMGNADADYRWLLEAALDEHAGKDAAAVAAYTRAQAYQDAQDQAEQLPLFPADEYLGDFYYRQRQYAKAAAAYDAALARYPNDPRALYGLGLAQAALGDAASSTATLSSFAKVWNGPAPPDLNRL